MPDLQSDNRIKLIAFFLPQYHRIPENDDAWGEGFTEWRNVKKAEALFPGHYQPRVPFNNNYYNLLDNGVMEWQSNLAQKYGIYGFCYYHYWFKDGKKLLEKPIEDMLSNDAITIPYCFCWANENWTKRWDGRNGDVIVEQDYGQESDWEKHLEYLLDYFADARYITLDGKPVFIIYKPDEITCLYEMLDYWNKRVLEFGYKGICYMIQSSTSYYNPIFKGEKFDYQIKFEPFFSYGNSMRFFLKKASITLHTEYIYNTVLGILRKRKSNFRKQRIIDYDKTWHEILKKNKENNLIEGAFVDWDNTARTKTGYRTEGSSPEKFKLYYSKLLKKIARFNEPPIIFINAWNEWAEGAYLEPDERYGYQYLEAIKETLSE